MRDTYKNIKKSLVFSNIYIWGVLVLFLVVGLSLLNYSDKKRSSELSDNLGRKNPAYQIYSDDHILGNIKTAKVIMINYSDTECPSCKVRHFDLKDLVEKYGSDIAIVSRYSPPPVNKFKNSFTEAKALECASVLAGEDVFWRYSDEIYNNTKSKDSLLYSVLIRLAENIGIHKKELELCLMENKKVEAKVRRDIISGTLSGLQMVPSAILLQPKNGDVILVGGSSKIRITNALNALLNK